MLSLLLILSCAEPGASADPPPPVALEPERRLLRLSVPADRTRSFDQAALERGVPLQWVSDDGDGQPQPSELRLVGLSTAAEWAEWFGSGEGTARLELALQHVGEEEESVHEMDDARGRQVARLRAEVRAARPAVGFTDLQGTAGSDRAFVRAMASVSEAVEDLYRTQLGSALHVPSHDPLMMAVFDRNHGLWCVSPVVGGDRDCLSSEGHQAVPFVGWYPASLQTVTGFCDSLGLRLSSRFTVVREQSGGLETVSYAQAWPERSARASQAMAQGASALAGPDDAHLRTYVRSVAEAFRRDTWVEADLAWRTAAHPRWYLRVAPDETRFDPCGRKAAFQLVLGRPDKDATAWLKRLELGSDTLGDVGRDDGTSSAAWVVPEMVHIVVASGGASRPRGVLAAQHAQHAGGRAVVFTNPLETHEDRFARVSSIFCPDTLEDWRADDRAWLLVRTLGDMAGGRSAGLELVRRLGGKGVLSVDQVRQVRLAAIELWLADLMSGTRTDGSGLPEVQSAEWSLGDLLARGSLSWHPDRPAGNGRDLGCLEVAAGKAFGVPVPSTPELTQSHAASPNEPERTGELVAATSVRWLRYPMMAVRWSVRL